MFPGVYRGLGNPGMQNHSPYPNPHARTTRNAALMRPQSDQSLLLQHQNSDHEVVKTGRAMGYDERPSGQGVINEPPWLGTLPGLYRRAMLQNRDGNHITHTLKKEDLHPGLQKLYTSWVNQQRTADHTWSENLLSVNDFITSKMPAYLPLVFTKPPEDPNLGEAVTRDVPGLLTEAADNYMRGRWTQGEQHFIQGHGARIGEVYGRHHLALNRFGQSLENGDYDVPNAITDGLNAQLSGQVDLTTLEPVLHNALSRIRRQFIEQTLPAINNRAIEAGHTGSTRHKLLQELGLKELLEKQNELTATMINHAYQGAQDRVQNAHLTTGQLNEQAIRSKRDNRQGVLDVFDRTNTTDDQFSERYLATWNAPVSHTQQQLENYASILYGQNMGSKQTQPIFRNRMAGVLGGALSGYAATGHPIGAVIGGILGSQS